MNVIQDPAYAFPIETLVILGVFLYSFFKRYQKIAENTPGETPDPNADEHSRRKSVREEVQQHIKRRAQAAVKAGAASGEQNAPQKAEVVLPSIQRAVSNEAFLPSASKFSPQAESKESVHKVFRERTRLRQLFLYREIMDAPVAWRDK